MGFDEQAGEAFRGSLENFGLPGVAWHVERGAEVAAGVHGSCRLTEGSAPLPPDQKWHWGSCAKALTATVVASLVDAGHFKNGWDTALGQVLPPDTLPPERALAAVTLRQLASHRAGVVLDLEAEEEEGLRKAGAGLSFPEQRRGFVRLLSEKALAHPPGEGFGYSNAGYALLSAAAEAALQQPWEEIVMGRAIEPLGMTTFGFGSPPVSATSACGHTEDGEVDEGGDAPWHHASFSVHSTLADWARFARLHLQVLGGKANALAPLGVGPASARILQTPLSPATDHEAFHGPEKPLSMALGWQCLWNEPPEGQSGPAAATGHLWHSGTNFRWNSMIFLQAEPSVMVLAGLNSGSALARLAARLAFDAVIAAAS